VADDGGWEEGAEEGTGLSIVRALVRDELQGTLELAAGAGFEARVTFPA
jgi:two-component sensor histidine kinase